LRTVPLLQRMPSALLNNMVKGSPSEAGRCMSRLCFLLFAVLFVVRTPMVSYPVAAQQNTPNTGAPSAILEGKWVITYENPKGVKKNRTFTFARDKNGQLVGIQNDPAWQCDLTVRLKGDKLWMKLAFHKPAHLATPNLPPGTVLGDPISTIFEAKISGDSMNGQFYGENVLGNSIKFTGVREAKVEPVGQSTK
jgi:hypothetical protein